MSDERHEKHKEHEHSSHDAKPTDHCEIKWPTIYPVRIEPPAGDAQKYDSEQLYRRKQLRLARCLNWITASAAAVGLFGLVYLHGQLGAMKQTNEINESVQRAFVSFQHFQWARMQDPDHTDIHTWYVTATFENSGVTNATNVAGSAEMMELQAEPTEEQFRGPYSHFPMIGLAPKTSRDFRVMPALPEPLIFGIDLGPTITAKSTTKTHFNRQLFVWGWIYYRDVFFPGTKPHVTEFCNHIAGVNFVTANLNPLASQVPGAGINFVYDTCVSHNCDDEQCSDYQTIMETAEKPN